MGGRGRISGREAQYNAEISRRIEQLRIERRMMRGELATAAGVSASKLYGYECGASRWPAFRLRLIADYLRVPVSDLVPKTPEYLVSPAVQEKLY